MEIIVMIFFANAALAFHDGNVALRDLGEKQYRIMKAKSDLPIHGACWYDAINSLKVNCDKLNDQQHSLLALRLADCFLDDSGHPNYQCHLTDTDNARRECINTMSDRAFGVYNEFYTHAVHICFFLNHEIWQAQTQSNIDRLFAASTKMREQLEEATELQGIVLDSQREGLKLQKELLDNGKELGVVIRSSADTVSGMVVDFKESAKDQRELLYEIFSYMQTFQNWVLAEVSWFQSIVYYTIACIICALLSSSKRTADSRIHLFTILSLNVIAERMLARYVINSSPNDKIQLVTLSWHFRKISLGLCLLTLLYSYYSYYDSGKENSKILQRIENRLVDLQSTEKRIEPLRYSKRLALKRINNNNNETQ